MDPVRVQSVTSFQQLYDKQSKELESILSANRLLARGLSIDHVLTNDNLSRRRFNERTARMEKNSIEQPLLLDDHTDDVVLPVMNVKSTLQPFSTGGGTSPQLADGIPRQTPTLQPFSTGGGTSPQLADGIPRQTPNSVSPGGVSKGARTGVLEHMFRQDDHIKKHVETIIDSSRSSPDSLHSLYYHTGFWQSIAKSSWFQTVSLTMISMNVIWMGFDIDLNHAPVLCEAPLVFQLVDNVFCSFFFLELLVQFFALSRKVHAFCDAWFVFDLILVIFMVWETWIMVLVYIIWQGHSSHGHHALRQTSIMRVFRVARFTRVFRTGRWLRNFPELAILATGMVAAMRSVGSVLGFMLLVVYLFSVMFTLLLSGTEFAVFDTIPQAANFLLCQTLCGFDAAFISSLLDKSLVYYMLFLLYLFLTSLTLMNLLIGVLVQGVSEVSAREKEHLFAHEIHKRVLYLCEQLDTDHSQTISSDELQKVLLDKTFLLELNDIDVDVVALADFAAFIFRECDELTFSEFEQLVMQFRASKSAAAKDVLGMQKYISQELCDKFGQGFMKHT